MTTLTAIRQTISSRPPQILPAEERKQAVLLRTQQVETIDKTSVGKINKLALRGKYLHG